jgi:hypothetical protein
MRSRRTGTWSPPCCLISFINHRWLLIIRRTVFTRIISFLASSHPRSCYISDIVSIHSSLSSSPEPGLWLRLALRPTNTAIIVLVPIAIAPARLQFQDQQTL